MAGSARIDELKKKFDENPARYFAPLANEYRKAGEIDQAIEICRTYLAEKPGHMSGLIVFGQALYEAKRFDEARGTFEQALGLDPENLIALRHLGDIARDTGDIGNARRWYQRVLDADPRNEEIATQMATLPSESGTDAAASTEAAAEGTADASFGWGDINPEGETGDKPPAGVSPDATTAVMEPIRLEQSRPADVSDIGSLSSRDAAARDERAPNDASTLPIEPASLEEPLKPAPEKAPEGIERSVEFETPPPGRRSVGDLEVEEDFVPPPAGERPDMGLEVMEFEAPRESATRDDALEVMEFEAPPSASVARAGDLEVMEFEPPAELHAPPEPPREKTPPAAGDTPEAFVTETMAELYLQQGYRDDALGVYRQLLERTPNDPHLRERVRQLESGGRSSVPMAAISDEVIAAAQESRSTPSHPTVRSFFSSIAARRPRVSAQTRAAAVAEPAPPPPPPPPPPAASAAPPAPEPASPPSLPRSSVPAALLGSPEPEAPAPAPEVDEAFGSSGGDWPAFDESELASNAGTEPDLSWSVPPVMDAPSLPEAEPVHEPMAASASAAHDAGNVTSDTQSESMNSLFGGASVTGADERAASTLAEAFSGSAAGAPAAPPAPPPAPEPAAPAATPTDRGRAARPADTELSLDSVFGGTPPRPGSGVRQTGGFSFDQFFSDSAVGRTRPKTPPGGSTASPSPPAASAPLAEEDEVAQFTQWLEGLKKK